MKAMTAAQQRVSFDVVAWLAACFTLSLLAGIAMLPLWVVGMAIAPAALRLILAARGRSAPPRWVRVVVSLLTIGLLFLEYRTFNGLAAGTALLCLVAGLKLLETDTRRDIYVVAMIIYFLSLAALLQGESFWLLSYSIGVCWLTTAALLRLTNAAPDHWRGRTNVATAHGRSSTNAAPGHWRGSLRYTGRLLAQALPLALAFWLFFPRFDGPLWQLAEDGRVGTSGLGDSMSPGDITDLAMSDEVAFRVRFSAGTPPPAERYWRGPVLHDFDGHTWRRVDSAPVRAPPLLFTGAAYRYTVSLEPNDHHWIFVLDWPSQWDLGRASLTEDYMLVQTVPITQPLDVVATSYGHATAAEPLSSPLRDRDTRLPPDRNPRARRLAEQLRAAHPGDLDYVHAVLDMFRQQPFYYTLTPPRLAADSVDGFLFETRRGFCGHYASAFATLMRAAGIPARVVTGYQGGTYNRFADYWILRQSDAHAWDEIWLENGWVRVDPTAMVAPERVDHGLNDIIAAGAPLTSRWQQRTPWLADTRLRLDALRLLWRRRILGFNESSQEKLLRLMHIPAPDGQKLALVLSVCLIAGMAWLTWQVGRELERRPKDPLTRAYATLCRRLAAIGLERRPQEGAEDYAARVALRRPDLGPATAALCRRYSDLRYRDPRIRGRRLQAAVTTFVAGVRAFRPRGSRGSS